MGEWASYALSDFLLFSPQAYFRQFALINAATFPLPVLFAVLALAVTALAGGGKTWHGRLAAIGLAMLWAGSAWLFHERSYTAINWAAEWFTLGFAVQALALLWLGIAGNALSPPSLAGNAALAVRIVAGLVVLLYPLQAALFGRDWREAETVGISPDATALFTLFVLVLCIGARRTLLLVVPLLWSVIALLTLWTMDAAEFWSFAALIVAAVIMLSAARHRRRRRSGPAPAD